MGSKLVRAAVMAGLALAVQAAGALSQGLRVEVSPEVGWYAALEELGNTAPTVGVWYLRLGKMEPAASLGGGIRLSSPSSPFSGRVSGFTTVNAKADANLDCYPGIACPAVIIDADAADVSILAAMADVLYAPMRGRVQPHLVLGAGFKHYDYSWDMPQLAAPAMPDYACLAMGICPISWDKSENAGDRRRYSETTPALRAGLGLTLELGSSALRVEVSDIWSPRGPDIGPGNVTGARSVRGRNPQHDLLASISWSLLRF